MNVTVKCICIVDAQWQFYVRPVSIFTFSPFCLQVAFLRCVYVSEQRENFPCIKVSDWFFTEKERVYCVVRVEYLNKIQVYLSFKRLKVYL